MTDRILVCSDLDRTILPNGEQAESAQARPLLRRLAARPEVTLVYVSGRDRALLDEAIRTYDLPTPEFAIGDVGTTVYAIVDGEWRIWEHWAQEIAPDWAGKSRQDLAGLLAGIDHLRLQEPARQGAFKLSYYAPASLDPQALLHQVGQRLQQSGIKASLIWSVDEIDRIGLLDVLPAAANKLHAIRFLMRHEGFDPARTVFAGDSGNDLPVLVSELNAVLVANAHDDVRQQALREAAAAGNSERLYLARGGFLGMNGCYSAGVLEGLVHYLPQTLAWLGDEPARR